jgi:ABC-type multidrug transport system fused ATPase/permease subunit
MKSESGVAAGEIVFEDVSFTYPNSQRPLYQKLKLTIRAGERVGLVGASAAGKTTLVKLLFETRAERIDALDRTGEVEHETQ